MLPLHATTVTETKTKLQQLESKMSRLMQTLHIVHNKRQILNQEMAHTEKDIAQTTRALSSLKHQIKTKQLQIAALNQLNQELNQQILNQQALLARHVRARYKMGEYQPIKWLLNQEDPYTTNRLLTYYTYLVKARQESVRKVMATQNKIRQNEVALNQEKNTLTTLEKKLKLHQAQLTENNHYHTALAATLEKEIHSQEQTLQGYAHNKAELTRLITALSKEGLTKIQIHKHFENPVETSKENRQHFNQGFMFYAPFGTAVHAVAKGKVVFSDWLNGYGFLLILDHGGGFMTLYAHNQSLLHKKGDFVNQREAIALVGHSGGLKKNGLYFELRRGGRAVPLDGWLS